VRQLGHVVSHMRVIRLSLKAAINTTSMRVGLSPGRLVVIHTRPATLSVVSIQACSSYSTEYQIGVA